MKPLNWSPTQEQIDDAIDVLGWAHSEMMNEITPRLGMAQMAMIACEDGAEDNHADWLFVEGAYNAADTLGHVLIHRAWRRYRNRQEGAE